MPSNVDDKDEEFMRHLRGELVQDPNPVIKSSATLIKDLLDHPALCEVPPLSNENLARFEARLHRVSVPVKHEESTWLAKWNHGWRVALPLAACVVVSVMVLRPDSSVEVNDAGKWRDLEDTPIVSVQDPLSTAQALAKQLSALGIESQLSKHDKQVTLEAYIPESKQQEVERILAPHQLRVGKNGELSIGFKQP